jgi:hypothetical protein
VLAYFNQTSLEEAQEHFKFVAVGAVHQVYVVLSQLERRTFEAHTTRAILEHKAEVNMDDVPLPVHQDVAVVSVFYGE